MEQLGVRVRWRQRGKETKDVERELKKEEILAEKEKRGKVGGAEGLGE